MEIQEQLARALQFFPGLVLSNLLDGTTSLRLELVRFLEQRKKTLKSNQSREQQFLHLGLDSNVYERFTRRSEVIKTHWLNFQEISPFNLMLHVASNIHVRNPWRPHTDGEWQLQHKPRPHYHLGLESSLKDLMITAELIRERFTERPGRKGDLFFHGTCAAVGEMLVEKVRVSEGKHDFGEGFYTWKDNPENDAVEHAMSWALSTSCLFDSESELLKFTNNPLLFVWDIPEEAFGWILNADVEEMPIDGLPKETEWRKYHPPAGCDTTWKRIVWLVRHGQGIKQINDNLFASMELCTTLRRPVILTMGRFL